MEEQNPRLKELLLETVENQLTANDPPETKKTLDRLISQGITEYESKILIAQAVSVEIFDVLKNQHEFNIDRYLKNLKQLPEIPKELETE